jgi:hypothetical protein
MARSWVSVGRRAVDGRCFDETEAVRDGFWRGLFSLLLALLCCRESVPVVRRGRGAGLWAGRGAAVAGAAGGLRDVALIAESAELFEAAVKLEYPESLRRSMLVGIGLSWAGGFSAFFRSLDRFVLTLAWAVGEALREKFSRITWPPSLSSEW